MIWALAAVCGLAGFASALRWLRVAQREHYLAPSVSRFAVRWWTAGGFNVTLLLLSVAGLVGSWFTPWAVLLVAGAQAGPLGLTLRGRTSPLAWTKRLWRLAGFVAVIVISGLLAGGLTGSAFLVALSLFALPVIVDLGLYVLAPVESRLGDRWVNQAAARLTASGARVVALTGSYGKTTTKHYVAHLLTGTLRTVASPASFNNRMGLARAVNEQLVPGTQVFVAEMGTYGRGEIADLCSWMQPEVAALVSIGPVHLERFKTEERIVEAKAEILDRARVGVVAIDHPLLAALAEERSAGMEVIPVSGEGREAKVTVRGGSLLVDGVVVAPLPADVFAVNLAVAVGAAIALGVPVDAFAGRLDTLPKSEHRQTLTRSERGFSIIDDTFNSNPAGARAALRLLERVSEGGRSVVVTPGMVELGPDQFDENRSFAEEVVRVADDLIVVGETNRRALISGSAKAGGTVTVVANREEAVDWVRNNLGPGDVVLYENDLPDHYP